MRTFWYIALLYAMLGLPNMAKNGNFFLHLSKTAIFLQYLANQAMHAEMQYTKMCAWKNSKDIYKKVEWKKINGFGFIE